MIILDTIDRVKKKDGSGYVGHIYLKSKTTDAEGLPRSYINDFWVDIDVLEEAISNGCEEDSEIEVTGTMNRFLRFDITSIRRV